jgi:putative MATE family efflux protein
MTEGVIWKQLLKFFFPIMLGTLFQQLYSTVDAMIVGRLIGADALAAVGATGTYIELLVGFFVGLSSGAAVLIAQYFGAGKKELVSDSVHTAVALSAIGGIVAWVAGTLLSPAVLSLLQTPESIYSIALGYLRIYFIGMFPALVYNMGTGIFRAVGDSKRPLYYLIIASVVNIVLDVVFIVCFHMGVEGTAWATTVSQIISAILILTALHRQTGKSYQLKYKKIRIDWGILLSMLKIGIPTGIQSMMYNASNMIIQSAVNQFGTATIAAWTAYGKVDLLYWMVINSMGISVTTVAGQNFGAGKPERIRETVRTAMVITTVFTIAMSTVLYVFCPQLLRLFTSDAEVITIGISMMRMLVPCYITFITIEILSGAIRGCGHSLVPTLITVLGVCVLRAVWVFVVLPIFPGMGTIIAAYPVTWILSSIVFFLYYKKGKWLVTGTTAGVNSNNGF